jgi:hypothetical protein
MSEAVIEISAAPALERFSWPRVWFYSFFRPTVPVYERLVRDPHAGFGRAFVWAFLSSLGSTAVAVALLAITGSIAGFELLKNPQALPAGRTLILILALLVPVVALGGILTLLLNTVISHLIAKVERGKGSFRRLTYAMSTYLVPVSLVSLLISLIPGVGAASFLVELYSVYLDTIAIKAVHGIGWGRAAAAAGIPFALSLLVKGLLILAAVAIVFALAHNSQTGLIKP